jgi:hypothetical protein
MHNKFSQEQNIPCIMHATSRVQYIARHPNNSSHRICATLFVVHCTQTQLAICMRALYKMPSPGVTNFKLLTATLLMVQVVS